MEIVFWRLCEVSLHQEESLSKCRLKESVAIQTFQQNKAKHPQKIDRVKQFLNFSFHEIRVPFNKSAGYWPYVCK